MGLADGSEVGVTVIGLNDGAPVGIHVGVSVGCQVGVIVGVLDGSRIPTCGRTLVGRCFGEGKKLGIGLGMILGVKVMGFPFWSRLELDVLVSAVSEPFSA